MANTLHITKDNEVVDMKVNEIFDSKKYNSLIGVTFSISASFMNKYLSGFKRLEVVVGIPEERVRYGANAAAKHIKAKIEGDLNDEPVKLYQGLTTEIKNKLSKDKVELMVPIAHVIHSKFYLLEDTDTGENRLVTGSANLSEQAFLDTTNQFENIIIWDNHPMFDIYKSHYAEDLRPTLSSYFSKKLLEINKKRIKKYDEKNIDEVILLNNEEVQKIKKDSVLETIDNTDKKIALGVIPADIRNEMRNITDDRSEEIKKERERKKQEDTAYTLIKESVSPRAKKPKMKSKSALKKVIQKRVEIKVATVSDSGLPKRATLVNAPEQRNTPKDISGLFVPHSLDKDKLLPMGKRINSQEIKTSLETINKLIQSFEKYTVKYEDSYGARVMEAILYAFTSPFIFEIKERARSEEERNDIPQFLFLGGTAGSGKSSLLKVMSKLINQPNGMNYNSIRPDGEHGRKKKIVDTIHMWMAETNVSPLLIDEIPEEFFTNMNYGNELIVNTSNRTAYNVQPSPALIGTTNADGYTLEERARRRSYYLRLDKTFDELFREESQPVYNTIYNELSSDLFEDFVLRFAERLNDDNLNWASFGEAGKIDFLYHTREIFKEYYAESNIPLPRYFPITRYDDSKETNQEKWRKLYLGTSQNDFKFDEISGNLLFKLATLDENISRYGGGRPSEVYKNALTPKVIIGSKDGTDIELDTPLFFEWINVENPYISLYKDKISSYYQENSHHFIENNNEGSLSFNISKIANTNHLSTIDRLIEYIPENMIIKINGSQVTVSKEFKDWLGIENKKSLWSKIFSY